VDRFRSGGGHVPRNGASGTCGDGGGFAETVEESEPGTIAVAAKKIRNGCILRQHLNFDFFSLSS